MTWVTVVIPTFNMAHYLPEVIGSVRGQTHRDIEIVVVDDGSTDDTRAVLASYPEVRYTYQQNRGVAAARNTGMRLGTGEYFAFLDADDCLTPTSIERRAAFLDRYRQVGAVFTDLFLHEDPARPAVRGHYVEEDFPRCATAAIDSREGCEIIFNSRFFEYFVAHRIGMWPGTLMVRRGNGGQPEFFRDELRQGEMPEYAYRISYKYVMGYIDEPLFHYNKHRSVLTANEIAATPSHIAVLEALARDLAGEGPRWQRLVGLVRRQTAHAYFALGYHHFSQGAADAARPMLRKSLALDWRGYRAYVFFALSFLPRGRVEALRRLKRRLRRTPE